MKQLLLTSVLAMSVMGTAWAQLRVVGSWRVNYFEQGNSRTLCYQCPIITFRQGGTGTITNGRPLCKFTWAQQGDELMLEVPQEAQVGFPVGHYHLSLISVRGSHTLTLAGRNDLKYVLTPE